MVAKNQDQHDKHDTVFDKQIIHNKNVCIAGSTLWLSVAISYLICLIWWSSAEFGIERIKWCYLFVSPKGLYTVMFGQHNLDWPKHRQQSNI